jgi:hypothetical protein
MTRRSFGRAAALGAILLASAAMQAAPTPLPLLGAIEPGRWELRGAGNTLIGGVCLGDPGQLVQPQHLGQTCQRSLLAADARTVTVRYTCPGTGFGRTSVLVETPRLVQIDSQGIAGGTPFQIHAEARKVGPCR